MAAHVLASRRLLLSAILLFLSTLFSHAAEADKDDLRLKVIQDRLLDLVSAPPQSSSSNGSSSSSSSNAPPPLQVLEGLLSGGRGKEAGLLALEALVLGARRPDAAAILSRFLGELRLRVSPALLEALGRLKEQVLEADSLDHALRALDLDAEALGHLQQRLLEGDALGLDLELILKTGQEALAGWDLTSVLEALLRYASPSSSSSSSSSPPPSSKPPPPRKQDKTPRLLRPLLTSLLKQYEVDLDPDAVLEVVAPFAKAEVLTQLLPLVAMATRGRAGQGAESRRGKAGQGAGPSRGKAGQGAGPSRGKAGQGAGLGVLGNVLGAWLSGQEEEKGAELGVLGNVLGAWLSGQEEEKGAELGGVLGGVGALLGGGGGLDMKTMMQFASLFGGGGGGGKRRKEKRGREEEEEVMMMKMKRGREEEEKIITMKKRGREDEMKKNKRRGEEEEMEKKRRKEVEMEKKRRKEEEEVKKNKRERREEEEIKKKRKRERREEDGLTSLLSVANKMAEQNGLDFETILEFSSKFLGDGRKEEGGRGGRKEEGGRGRRKEEGGGRGRRKEEEGGRGGAGKNDDDLGRKEGGGKNEELAVGKEEGGRREEEKRVEEEKKKQEGARNEKEEGEEEGKRNEKQGGERDDGGRAGGPSLARLLQRLLAAQMRERGCGRRLLAAAAAGRAFAAQRLEGVGGLEGVLAWLEGVGAAGVPLEGVDLAGVASTLRGLARQAQDLDGSLLEDVLDSLEENPALADALAAAAAPPAASLALLLAAPPAQEALWQATAPRLQAAFASFGLGDVTLDDFPERLAPLAGLLGRAWGLGLDPAAALLRPLRELLRAARAEAAAALEGARAMDQAELRRAVYRALRDDVIGTTLDVRKGMTSRKCFSQRLCDVIRGRRVTSLGRAVASVAGVTMATGVDGVTEKEICNFLNDVLLSLEGNCEDSGGCEEEDEASAGRMDLKYEHNEL